MPTFFFLFKKIKSFLVKGFYLSFVKQVKCILNLYVCSSEIPLEHKLYKFSTEVRTVSPITKIVNGTVGQPSCQLKSNPQTNTSKKQ